ncbi:MAG: type VI secretion system protein TssL, long form [Betaproteobacteria bacterium]
MAERPGEGVDPDATVAIPSLKPEAGPLVDPDATVSMPLPVLNATQDPGENPDATIAIPARAIAQPPAAQSPPASEPDPEATDPMARSPFFLPPDPEATVAIPPRMARPAAQLEAPALDPDATIAIPTPGRRRNPFAPKPGRDAVRADLAALGGFNPLVEAANPILGAVPQIRQSLRHPDAGALRETLAEQLDTFEAAAGIAGADAEVIQVARHALCALLDESASRTPWGASWSENGLVRMLLDGDTTGAKFFDDVARALEAPLANGDLIEFFYACLALGYEGKYRGAEGGGEALEAVRLRIHGHVAVRRPPAADGELSANWRGVKTRSRRIPGALLLWGLGSALALVLVVLYLIFVASLGALSDPVARDLARLAPPAAPEPTVAAASTASGVPAERVATHLAEAIKAGQVVVTEDALRSTIVLRSDRLFASGSARLEAGLEPVVLRITEALERVPGAILVTGHTDDLPIRSARFHSNWELSTGRAQSVVKLMGSRLSDPARLKAEGVADSQPVGPNDSEANRARNRRVVIILRAAP